ncbi:MAG: hypothetical protein JWN32_1956 [Solirubrobacterales bacterium]|jgi:transposase|nr:hypothetical protein [Solirubrobacterales bacterium]
MSTTHTFSLERRERFLALLAVGYSVEAAAAAAETSRQTVARWLARGRAEGAPVEHASFARRFDEIRAAEAEAEAVEPEQEEPLIDGMTWLEPERMAELTEEQRQRAREIFVAECDARPPARMTDAEWKRERREILRGEADWSTPEGGGYPYRPPRQTASSGSQQRARDGR